VIRLANALSKGNQVHIYEHEPWRTSSLTDLLSNDITLHRLEISPFWDFVLSKIEGMTIRLKINLSFVGQLRKYHFRNTVRRIQPDVVNSHVMGSDARVSDIAGHYPVVISMHGCYEDQLRKDLSGFPNRAKLILSKVRGVIYAAKKNLEVFEHLDRNPRLLLEKVNYGYEREGSHGVELLNLPSDTFVFGMVARAIPSKGWVEAIEGFIALKASNSEIKTVLILVMDENAYFESLKLKYEFESNIIFYGYSKRPELVIRNFHVGLLPSYFPGESLPNSIIEYLAEGIPIIATAIGEIPEMISNRARYAGQLIHYSDNSADLIKQLSRAMCNYVNDKTFYENHRSHTSYFFSQFSMENCLAGYMKMFNLVINK